MENPYSSPDTVLGPASGSVPAAMPAVVSWYRIYAASLAILYLLLVAGGIALLVFRRQLAYQENAPEVFLIQGAVFVLLGIPFFVLCAVGLFIPAKSWGWIYGLVLIAVGMTSCCCIPFCIPLLIFWIKPETQAYFGRGSPKVAPG